MNSISELDVLKKIDVLKKLKQDSKAQEPLKSDEVHTADDDGKYTGVKKRGPIEEDSHPPYFSDSVDDLVEAIATSDTEFEEASVRLKLNS